MLIRHQIIINMLERLQPRTPDVKRSKAIMVVMIVLYDSKKSTLALTAAYPCWPVRYQARNAGYSVLFHVARAWTSM